MTPEEFEQIKERTTRYRGEDGKERAVILWSDWEAIQEELSPTPENAEP